MKAASTNTATEAGLTALHAYLDPLITAHTPLPSTTNWGKTTLARVYIGGITGASSNQVRVFAKRAGLASGCGGTAPGAVHAECPGDRPDRREAVARGDRLQRGR
jgi:hypothetical protein